MLERTAYCRNCGINFRGGCTYQPSIGLCHRADFVGTGAKIYRRKHGMNQRSESSPAWTLNIGAEYPFDLNAHQIDLVETRSGSKRRGGLDFERGTAGLR